MLEFIRRHWIVYLVLAILAISLGLGAAHFVGVWGSSSSDSTTTVSTGSTSE